MKTIRIILIICMLISLSYLIVIAESDNNKIETRGTDNKDNQDLEWPMIHHDAQNTGFSKISTPYETYQPYQSYILWEHDIKKSKGKSPVIADIDGDAFPEIFIASGSKLYCFDSVGEIRWTFKAGKSIDSSPAIADIDLDGSKEIIFSSSDKNLYCLGSKGKEKWSYDLAATGSESSPTIANITNDYGLETVIGTSTTSATGAGSFQTYLLCITYNGTLKWKYKDTGFARVDTTPAVGNLTGNSTNEVVAGASWGYIVYIDSNGKILSRQQYDKNNYFSSPTIINIDKDEKLEIIYGVNDLLYCNELNGNNEKMEWKFSPDTEVKITATPSVADINGDGEIEVIFGSDKLYCLNSKGKKLWTFDTNSPINHSSAAIVNIDGKDNTPEIIFGSGNKLYCLDSDGKEKWSFTSPDNKDIQSSPAVCDIDNDNIPEIVFVSGKRDEDGIIYAIELAMEFDTIQPDLTLKESDITISKKHIIEGDNITINATIHNNGKINASSCKVTFYAWSPSNEVEIGTKEIKDVRGMRGNTRVSINWTAILGAEKIHVKISDCDPKEKNIDNNEAFKNITIYKKPDLYITPDDITFSNKKPIKGDKIKINVKIHNEGGLNLSCLVTFYDKYKDNVTQIENQITIEVTGNGTTIISVNWTPEFVGEHEILVEITNSTYEESTLTNNKAHKKITVSEDNFLIILIIIIIIILIIVILLLYLKLRKSKTKKCPNCGKKVQITWKSCPACGTALELEELKCPNCKKIIEKTWKSCPACGHTLEIEELKCQNCNEKVEKTWKTCPTCGNTLEKEELKCPNCGEKVKKNWKSCPACGITLAKEKLKCPKCKEKVEKTWKSCPACGNSLENEELKCPNCQEKIKKNWKLCPACGSKLEKEELKCPSCGEKIEKTWKSCPVCSNSLKKLEIKCIKCGNKLKETWKSCPFCGNVVDIKNLKKEEQGKFNDDETLIKAKKNSKKKNKEKIFEEDIEK